MNDDEKQRFIEMLDKASDEIVRNTERKKGNWFSCENTAFNRKMIKECLGIEVDPNDPIIFLGTDTNK